MRTTCRQVGGLAALAVLLGCSDNAASPNSGPRVAVTALESGRLAIVDLTQRKVVARLGLPLRGQGVPGVSTDGALVYYGGFNDGVNTLVEVDIAAGVTRRSWVLPTRGFAVPGDTGKVLLRFSPAVTMPVNGGNEFLLWPAERNKMIGIARYRPADDTVLAFRPMPKSFRVSRLQGRTRWPAGTLVLGADQELGTPARLLFVSPDLAPVDSISLPASLGEAGQLIVDREERFGYARSSFVIFKVDLEARQVVAQTQTSSLGFLSMSADGSTILEVDPGRQLDFPGSGLVRLYSTGLQPLGSVDLNPVQLRPTTWMAVGVNDSIAVVSAGTPPGTLGQTPQTASLFVINVRSKTVVDRIPLDEYGTGMLVKVP